MLTILDFNIQHKNRMLVDIKLSNSSVNKRGTIFTSVIIGTNGAGKSFILGCIADVFRMVECYKNNMDFVQRYDFYSLTYWLKGKRCRIEIYKKKVSFFVNEEETIQYIMPDSVLAVSYMLNDKFPYKEGGISQKENIYEYVGIRQVSNAAWINSVNKKICNIIIDNLNNREFMESVKRSLTFLKMQHKIKLIFEPKQKTLFRRAASIEAIRKKAKAIRATNSMNAYTATNIREEEIREIVSFLKKVKSEKLFSTYKKKDVLEVIVNLYEDNESGLVKYNNTLKKLMILKLLDAPRLILTKNENEFDFDYCSSGEKQFLFTIISIASKLTNTSLVLIDEPEISLHANWQMKYINYIKEVFKSHKGSYFILASHSHYIISDLKKESSSIISLCRNEEIGGIQGNLIESDTYAWSAENILYNIFNVRTVRNYYFEMDLRKLINIIQSRSDDIETAEHLIKKLSNYIYNDVDPLNDILYEARRYLENVR